MIKQYKKENKKLTENFNLVEFACKDGSNTIYLDEEIPNKLEKLREDIKRPIIINSGYRTIEYNKKVGGALNSYHCKGQAVDIKASGIPSVLLALYASRYFNGIIVYGDFIHCDTREKRYIKL